MMEELEVVVQEILRSYEDKDQWPTDITDRVFLAIEGNPERLGLYQRVVGELGVQGKNGQQVVNQYIGKRVKQLTTRENHGRCDSPRSSLIKSFEKH